MRYQACARRLELVEHLTDLPHAPAAQPVQFPHQEVTYFPSEHGRYRGVEFLSYDARLERGQLFFPDLADGQALPLGALPQIAFVGLECGLVVLQCASAEEQIAQLGRICCSAHEFTFGQGAPGSPVLRLKHLAHSVATSRLTLGHQRVDEVVPISRSSTPRSASHGSTTSRTGDGSRGRIGLVVSGGRLTCPFSPPE
ncbi:hypothetical protein M271_20605 [Streptomyces rapamycinicus NRRL 5491]|nr:hypothetical protein M271_20605 [Streptomyces rapamycinicus NRRL 5491]